MTRFVHCILVLAGILHSGMRKRILVSNIQIAISIFCHIRESPAYNKYYYKFCMGEFSHQKKFSQPALLTKRERKNLSRPPFFAHHDICTDCSYQRVPSRHHRKLFQRGAAEAGLEDGHFGHSADLLSPTSSAYTYKGKKPFSRRFLLKGAPD